MGTNCRCANTGCPKKVSFLSKTSLHSIYSSISDKEVLDKKRHFFGTTCIGASAVGIWPFHLDPRKALGPIRWTSLYLCVQFTAQFPTRRFWIKKETFLGQPVLAHSRLVSGPSTWTLGRP